jgi:multiple sugar transport system substrate-binding protein
MDPNNTSSASNSPVLGSLSGYESTSVAGLPPPPPTSPVPAASVQPVNKKKPIKKILFISLILLFVVGVLAMVMPFLKQNVGGIIGGPTEIVWWGLWEPASVVQPLIDEYQQTHPNVKITYLEQSREDYRERLTSALAGGSGPDIFRMHNTWVPMFRSSLEPVPSGVIAPSDYAQTFYPEALGSLSNGSEAVAIPLEFDSLALYVNDQIFDTYLKSAPTTWDELKALAMELTVKNESGIIQQSGVALGNSKNVDHWPEILGLLMMQNNVEMNNPASTENAAIALEYYTRFQTLDRVWDETLPNSTQMFANGKLAMYFAPSWRAHEIRKLNPSLRFSTVPVPQLPKSRPDEANLYYATYWAEGVNSESGAKSQAFDFLKFLVQKGSLEKMYQNASSYDQSRKFGEPFSRRDMLELLGSDPVVGSFVRQGPEAKTWYLQSLTWDGPTGINTQINSAYDTAVVEVVDGGSAERAIETAGEAVRKVLVQYGLIAPPPLPK